MSLTILEQQGQLPYLNAAKTIAISSLGEGPEAPWSVAGYSAPPCLFLELPTFFKTGLSTVRALTIVKSDLIPSDGAMAGPAQDAWTLWALTAQSGWTQHGRLDASTAGLAQGARFFRTLRETLQRPYLDLLASQTLEIRLIAPGAPTPAG